MKTKVIVIGNGMVGHKFCEKLVAKAGAGTFEITVFGEEPRVAYDRVHLSEYFLPDKTAESLALADRAWYEERSIHLRLGNRVTAIDRAAREVVAADGTRVPYDVLVLATGSEPRTPPIPPCSSPAMFRK